MADLPDRYGSWKTAHERLRLCTKDGTCARILDEVIVKDDSVGNVEWVVSVDSSVVRAHQHAAGARKKGAVAPTPRPSWSTGKDSRGPVAGLARRSISRSTDVACRSESCSRRDKPGTIRNSCLCWTGSGFAGPDHGAYSHDRTR